jgi:DNA-directed RNA polymerase subunit E'/Rpb7
MTTTIKKNRDSKITSIYSRSLLTKNIFIPITAVGKNIDKTIEETIKSKLENRCIEEGFVKTNSIKIINFTSGLIQAANISFEVAFECEICMPVEGMLITCRADSINKAGIKGSSWDDSPSPIIVFISRDQQVESDLFNDIKEGDKFICQVIGQRFELNDNAIAIIGSVVRNSITINKEKEKSQPKIVFE